MKKLICSLFMVFGIVLSAHPQTTTCSCGSFESGTTIEYQVSSPPGGGSVDCCRNRAIGLNDSYKFTWKSGGRGTYILVSTSIYATAAEAQGDCCGTNA